MIKPIDKKVSQVYPFHPLLTMIVKIWSMDTFVHDTVTRAHIDNDQSKIPNMGPYVAAFTECIMHAERSMPVEL